MNAIDPRIPASPSALATDLLSAYVYWKPSSPDLQDSGEVLCIVRGVYLDQRGFPECLLQVEETGALFTAHVRTLRVLSQKERFDAWSAANHSKPTPEPAPEDPMVPAHCTCGHTQQEHLMGGLTECYAATPRGICQCDKFTPKKPRNLPPF